MVGHSKGGAESTVNAVATNKNGIAFNPAPVQLDQYDLNASHPQNNKDAVQTRVQKQKPHTVYSARFVRGDSPLVRETGLEPVRHKTHAPQTCLSASSSTLARTLLIIL